ncbi:trypsin-like serine peptidase [Gloeothece verrucosa]|uniref:DNA/RNA non-specific endonuclease n=1 Tax=Gloeothece verrucosa (strain PCC 7822) TaxID=497965 RepID=E0UF70_GLOV7|nr:serine protease [Gloeothece verrucosa]ADN15441.1 DNA/RNA non-specific endonuclease [Gloeothece verrucosa PCC 7822]
MDSLIESLLQDILDGTSKINLADEVEKVLKDETVKKYLQDLINNPDINLNDLLPPSEKKTPEEELKINLEAIILTANRTPILIEDDTFKEAVDPLWKDPLENARKHIEFAIKASGRVQYSFSDRFITIGTAWLVTSDIVITNRHVADELANRDSSIDFRGEHFSFDTSLFKVERILHIEKTSGPDIAFLKLSTTENTDGLNRQPTSLLDRQPIPLSESTKFTPTQNVAIIGYPGRPDSKDEDASLIARILEYKYDVKRLQPGNIIGVTNNSIKHDCSTVTGNSGSVLLDLETGKALGIHYGGNARITNHAVPASVIKQRLQELELC